MSINPGGTNYSWNYSKPDKPGYSTQLIGTVLAIQEVQKMGYTMNGQPGAPQFWPDGNPMMNIRLCLCTPELELKTFTFQPAGKAARLGQKKSVHMDLFALTGNTDMFNLIGKTICIQTQEGYYGQGNPRPWFVSLVDGGPYKPAGELPSEFKVPQVLANAAASGGQVTPPQQPQYRQVPQQPQYQYQQPAQPQYQYQQQPPVQPQYQYQQPAMPMPAPQPPQPTMDPNIMQAMATQSFGPGVQVTYEPPQQADPVGGGSIYDDEMPF